MVHSNSSFLILFLLSISINVNAQQFRHIHVNENHLSSEEILALDQLAVGVVPNGFYWINFDNGEWGYEGNAGVQGVLPALAKKSQPESNDCYYAAGARLCGDRLDY